MTQTKRLLSYLGFAAVAVYCLAPFYWMTVSAFRRPQDQFDNSVIPARWSWRTSPRSSPAATASGGRC